MPLGASCCGEPSLRAAGIRNCEALQAAPFIRNEAHMSQAVAARFGKYAAREVRVGDCILDVVAYDKKMKLFHIVECKSHPTELRAWAHCRAQPRWLVVPVGGRGFHLRVLPPARFACAQAELPPHSLVQRHFLQRAKIAGRPRSGKSPGHDFLHFLLHFTD